MAALASLAAAVASAGLNPGHAGPVDVSTDARTAAVSVAAADPAVNLADPDAVCGAFAAALAAREAATDAGPADAYARAAAYADAALADALLAPPPPRAPGWAELAAHRARVTVSVARLAGEPPPDHDGVAYRAAAVVASASGRDAWRGPADRHTVYCVLHAAGPLWQVAGYDLG